MGETVEVHAYDWKIRDRYGDDDQAVIHCWGLDRHSTPHLLRFLNFPAFCHIELPAFVRNRRYTWQRSGVDQFMDMLSQRLGEDAPIRYSFAMKKKTYYYRGNRTFPMIQVSFNNLDAMRHCTNLLANPLKTDLWGFIKCNVHEDSIDMVRKMLTVRRVKYAQWFRITGHKVDPELRISTLENEYIVEWDTMCAVPEAECEGWSTKPGILAFDIECYSDNFRQMPDKYNAPHCAYMISAIYQKYQTKESRRRYGIIIGDCNHIPPEKLEHCEIIRVDNELEMVEAFARVTNETDPEIITGYNILGFDYPYLDHRIKRRLKEWPAMGRLHGDQTHMTSKTWASGAYGHQSINILQMEGRISIDMLPVVKRDHKLPMYNLDTVCKHFLGTSKHDVTAPQMFQIYEDMRNSLRELVGIIQEEKDNPGLKLFPPHIIRRETAQIKFDAAKAETTRVMEYCIQDSELVIDLMEKLGSWVALVEMSSIVGVTIVDLFTRGQQVRCMSQLYDLAASMGYVLDKRDAPTFSFKGGTVFEPVPGLYDNIPCWDFASLYPSIIQEMNICYTTLVPPELEHVVPDEDCNVIEFDQEEIEGEDDDDEDEDDLEEIGDARPEPAKKKVLRHYRFKFFKGHEGLLPRLVRELVTQRRIIRDEKMPLVKDPLVKGILDARQLALKVSANSFFGFLGVRNGGMMSLIEGAMSITARGRQLLERANNHLVTKYAHRNARIIYNDTDSTMADLSITDSRECQYWGEKLSHEFNGVKKGDPLPCAKDPKTDVYTEDIPGVFNYPIVFEFEKAMRMLLLKKKKYAALLIDKKGDFMMKPIRDANGKVIGKSDLFDMLLRGIVLARRDNCKFLRDTYLEILDVIMRKGNLEQALTILINAIHRLLNNQVSFEDLIIIKGLGSNYKSDSYFMKVFSDDLKRAGKPVSPGDRLDFLIVKDSTATLLGHKMRLREQYVESLNTPTPFEIDYMYYIEKALMNPINQLFEVGFKTTIAQLPMVYYRPTNRHKPIYMDRPVQIIFKMLEYGLDINTLQEAVKFNLDRIRDGPPAPKLTLKVARPIEPPTMKLKVVPSTAPASIQAAPASIQAAPALIQAAPAPIQAAPAPIQAAPAPIQAAPALIQPPVVPAPTIKLNIRPKSPYKVPPVSSTLVVPRIGQKPPTPTLTLRIQSQ